MVLKHNCIHGSPHQKPQAFRTVGRCDEFISVFPQQIQLSGIPVDAEQSAVGCHSGTYIRGTLAVLSTIAHIALSVEIAPSRAIVLRYRKAETVASPVYFFVVWGGPQ